MTPYYQDELITLYCGDARDVLAAGIEPADVVITDPVWPNCRQVFPGIDPWELFKHVLGLVGEVERVVVHLGCDSDPRFLTCVSDRWPFFRVCSLEYACPSYKGRLLYTGDIAYVFGTPPAPKPGAIVLPGKTQGIQPGTGVEATSPRPPPLSARPLAGAMVRRSKRAGSILRLWNDAASRERSWRSRRRNRN